MQSKAATVEAYLAEIPADRREAIQAVREVFKKNLDKGIIERMSYGMIGYAIPHSIYPNGYHCDPKMPLPVGGLASQKNAMSLYLMHLYMHPGQERQFRAAWAKTGKKLDMGKSCIRFKKLDDLALDVIADSIRGVTIKDYISYYETNLNASKSSRKPASASKKIAKKVAKKPSVKKSASKKTSTKK